MDNKILEKRLKELSEIIRNLNKIKHNYSIQYEMYVRDYFDILIDEIKNQ